MWVARAIHTNLKDQKEKKIPLGTFSSAFTMLAITLKRIPGPKERSNLIAQVIITKNISTDHL